MATHRISMLNGFSMPDTSGEVYLEPYVINATNDFWSPLIWIFEDGSTKTGLHGIFTVPQNYVDTANLVIIWTTTATSGDVEWDFDYRAVGGNDAESLDQATAQEAITGQNDTAPSATDERMEFVIALTDSNFAAGDTVTFVLSRDKSDAGDGISADVMLFEAMFEYADA